MKYLLLLSLLLVSCEGSKHQHPALVKQEQNKKTTGFYRIQKFTFERHDYIRFGGDSHNSGVVHDPECLYCKQWKDK